MNDILIKAVRSLVCGNTHQENNYTETHLFIFSNGLFETRHISEGGTGYICRKGRIKLTEDEQAIVSSAMGKHLVFNFPLAVIEVGKYTITASLDGEICSEGCITTENPSEGWVSQNVKEAQKYVGAEAIIIDCRKP